MSAPCTGIDKGHPFVASAYPLTLQGLDAGLLVHAEHHGVLGGQAQAHQVVDPLDILGSGDTLRSPRRCGCRPKDCWIRLIVFWDVPISAAIDRVTSASPRRGPPQGPHQHLLDHLVADRARPTRPRLIDDPVEAPLSEPATELGHCGGRVRLAALAPAVTNVCYVDRVTPAARTFVRGQGDRRLSDVQKAQLAAIGGSDEFQDALDEVGRRYPELSNE